MINGNELPKLALKIETLARQCRAQNCIIDAREELPHVARPHVLEPPRELLASVERAMRALTDAIRVRVKDEAALEDRLDEVAQGVVHDTIAKRRGADEPAFGFVDVKAFVGPGAIGLGAQLVLQFKKMVFQTMLECGDIRQAAFATTGFLISEKEVVPGGELVEHDWVCGSL